MNKYCPLNKFTLLQNIHGFCLLTARTNTLPYHFTHWDARTTRFQSLTGVAAEYWNTSSAARHLVSDLFVYRGIS